MKIVIGVSYNKQNNAENIAIWDTNRQAIEIITTRKAKERFNANMLVVKNADFTFFINQVNFTIGEQKQYPILKMTKEKYTIENGVIIFDYKRTKDNTFKALVIRNNQIKEGLLNSQTLKELKQIGYKCNYNITESGDINIVYKENNAEKEIDYSDNIALIDAEDSGWYKLVNNTMFPFKKCPVKTFESKTIERITGFKDSDIEEVDLSGAQVILAQAFRGCHKLKKVTFSNSLIRIDNQAFYDCPELKELKLPESLKELGTSIYNGPLVYMHNEIEGAIKPFASNTKIIMYGKSTTEDIIKVAYNENSQSLAYLEINTKSGQSEKKAIKKKQIDDVFDVYINYLNNKQVCKGNIIICGKTGNDYVYIDKAIKLKVGSFEELKDEKISDAVIANNEFIPKSPEWEWKYINITANRKENAGKAITSHLIQTADTGNILNDNMSTILSDYINLKCFSNDKMKRVVKSVKFEKKMQQERDKYPGFEWRWQGFRNYNNLPQLDNPNFKQDKRGWWSCYFGHPTKIHWIIEGYVNNQKQCTFSFGGDCYQGFTGISDAQMEFYLRYESEFIKAIDEMTTILKKDLYKQHISENGRFYEIAQGLIKKNKEQLLGPYGDIIKRFIKIKCPIPKLVIKDVINTIPDFEEIILNIIDKNALENLQLVYKFPNLTDLTSNEDFEDIQDSISNYIKSCVKDKEV